MSEQAMILTQEVHQLPPAPEPARPLDPAPANENELIAALQSGDEAAFSRLVDLHQSSMMRVARLHVSSDAIAEEVVQETWLGVLNGLHTFQRRSSLKTWIFSILINRARTKGVRENRMITFSAMANVGAGDGDSMPDPADSVGDEFDAFGAWLTPPTSWGASPEVALLTREGRIHIEAAIAKLPQLQQEVITLRDIQELTAEETCNILGIRETNQRVLLHRARAKVRQELDRYF